MKPNTKRYVAYYRVSTDKQGEYGLGMEAQHASVHKFIEQNPGELVVEYSEVEPASKHSLANRPQLLAALRHAKRTKATLLIAKLDRLSRSVLVTSQLLASGVDFIAVDLPSANRLTIQLMAVMAEHESQLISDRTKAAMAQAKSKGARFGASPETLRKATEAARLARLQRRTQLL